MMRKFFLIFVTIIFLLTAQHGIASQPVITGHLEGVELCAQFQCGVAVFVGQFKGQVNNRRGQGGFLVFINHQPLPPPGQQQFANITGGEWSLRAGVNLFQGDILRGTIVNNGDNTFTINAVLQVSEGGSGEIVFTGVLDHNDFPPTIDGDLAQPAAP
jgi:hypothetical protein